LKKPFPLIRWFGIISLIMIIGIAGFMIIEQYSFIDALYMTVITIATIGYREVKPLSDAGKVFNILFIISSFAIFTYALSRLTQYVVSGELADYLKNRKLMKAIDEFNDHVIICGFGRNGQQAAHTLFNHKTDFVAIDNNSNHFNEWLEEHPSLVYINGDATDDDVLIKAGVIKAKALLLTLPADADNVFIVLSARSLNKNIKIISRAALQSSVGKLKTAGADHVILPDKIGGSHMATLVSKPDVIEFINYLWGDENESVTIESIDYNMLPGELKDQSIEKIIQWKHTGINCIGIKEKEGKFMINPPHHTLIQKGMKIMLFGSEQQIKNMKQQFAI